VGDLRVQKDADAGQHAFLTKGERVSHLSQELRLPLLSSASISSGGGLTLYEHLAGRWALVYSDFPSEELVLQPEPGYALFRLEARGARGEVFPPLVARGLYLKAPPRAVEAPDRPTGFQATVDGVRYRNVTALYLTGGQIHIPI